MTGLVEKHIIHLASEDDGRSECSGSMILIPMGAAGASEFFSDFLSFGPVQLRAFAGWWAQGVR